jgi:pimeloyl-ACP methyl ester carboxylesterase
MSKKTYLISIVFVALMTVSMFSAPVLASRPDVTYDSTWHYTRYVGVLGGADYEIFMPDNWNGHLVIGCKGFTLSTTTPFPTLESTNTHQIGLQFMTSSALAPDGKKFAYSQSTYDEIGFCMKAGMLHTHQLTEYIIDNFHVTGKVFLIGLSMGGQIDQMLVDKFPDLYAGVLDVCGNKDTTAFYNYWRDLAILPASPSAIRTYLLGAPTSLPLPFANAIPDASLLNMRTAALQVMADVEAECGGTPETKPQAYDRLSPTCHADISVPVISMVARADLKVPIQHFNAYYDAVAATGCIGNYRSYIIPGIPPIPVTTHCDTTIINNVPTYFMKLFNWVIGGTVPAVTGKPLP